MDWLPTFASAAGKTDIKEDLLDGYSSEALGREYKIHLDGYDLTEHLKDPQGTASPRKEIFYFSDDGDLTALRYGPWKLIFYGTTHGRYFEGLAGSIYSSARTLHLQLTPRSLRARPDHLQYVLRLDD